MYTRKLPFQTPKQRGKCVSVVRFGNVGACNRTKPKQFKIVSTAFVALKISIFNVLTWYG